MSVDSEANSPTYPADESKAAEIVSSDHLKAVNEFGSTVIDIDPAAERRLLWKFDLRILPVLAGMYVLLHSMI